MANHTSPPYSSSPATESELERYAVQLSEGVKIRAVIDSEGMKAMLLMNGGGAVALLAFLPFAFAEPEFLPVAKAAVWGLLIFQIGVVCAVVHNAFRRDCSHIHELHGMRPPSGKLLGFEISEPRVCRISRIAMWSSISMFVLATVVVFVGALATLRLLA